MPSPALAQRLSAEFLGTAFLLATVIGSGIMGANLAGGNMALALLGNTLPTGAILIVLILILGPVSGAHFNPAVTLVLACAAGCPSAMPHCTWWSQVTGGIVGVWAAHVMFDLPRLAGLDDGADRPGTMVCRDSRELRAPADDSWLHSRGVLGNGIRCGPLHHRRLLVHRVDLVRQSGGHDRAQPERYLRRHRTAQCRGIHRGPAHRGDRRSGRRPTALVGARALARTGYPCSAAHMARSRSAVQMRGVSMPWASS